MTQRLYHSATAPLSWRRMGERHLNLPETIVKETTTPRLSLTPVLVESRCPEPTELRLASGERLRSPRLSETWRSGYDRFSPSKF